MRYIFDIDGTVLTQQAPGEYEKALPLEGAVEAVNVLYDAGHQIVFYTSRSYKYMQLTINQLKEFGFKFHHVSFSKPHGDVIVDNLAFPFPSWNEIRRIPSEAEALFDEVVSIWKK